MKKRTLKRATAFTLTAALTISSVMPAFAAGWQQDAKGWWWKNDNASYPKNEWVWLDGNGDGVSECYYFDGNGYLVTNTTTPDGCLVNADGQWMENGQVKTKGTVSTSQSSAAGIKGTVYPTLELQVNDHLWWMNHDGGTVYTLYYFGGIGDPTAAGYQYKKYPNMQDYWDFDTWTCPDGTVIDYNRRVMENGKIKTATAEELGLSYEPGKIRDVPYDSNMPLKRVVDFYALNIERITPENITDPSIRHHGLGYHATDITEPFTAYVLTKLSGQKDNFRDLSWYSAEELDEYNAVVDLLRNWLNSFDFEHMSETQRLEEIRKLLRASSYDQAAKEARNTGDKSNYYRVLVEKKGICIEFARTVKLLSLLLGLKCSIIGDSEHAIYVIQADGIPYAGENGGIDYEDHRVKSKLGTRQSYNYYYGESIMY